MGFVDGSDQSGDNGDSDAGGGQYSISLVHTNLHQDDSDWGLAGGPMSETRLRQSTGLRGGPERTLVE